MWKKWEILEKLRIVGDKWKRVYRMVIEKKDYFMKCILEVEIFEVKYNECMEVFEMFLSEIMEMVDIDKDLLYVEFLVDEVFCVGYWILLFFLENEYEILEVCFEKLCVMWKEMRDVCDEFVCV